MRFPKFQALFAIVALAFATGVFAADAPNTIPQLNEAQIDQLEAAEDTAELNEAVEALVEAGADPRAVAAALAARGQTNAQIAAALNSAGVALVDVQSALSSANIARSTLPQQNQAPSSQPAVEVTGAGLLVAEDGTPIFVETEADQAMLAAAFIAGQVSMNPNYFNDDNAARGISQVLTNAILAQNPNANADVVLNAVLEALQDTNFGAGGNVTSLLARALQDAADNVGGGITLPPVSANS